MDTEKKKKIVVLVMSCQDPFFKKEENLFRDPPGPPARMNSVHWPVFNWSLGFLVVQL